MKISVVTAVCNRVASIKNAIDSVQAQTWLDVEHLIQDCGSTDGTMEIICQCARANTAVVSQSDHGIYDAINKGIGRATGDIIGLMHSDDVFAHDGVLAKIAAVFEATEIDGVYGDLQYVATNDSSRIIRHWHAGEYRPSMLRRGWMPPHPTLYLRKEVFNRYGLYDTSFRIAADYDAILRYLAKGQIKLAYIPEVLVKMQLGGESNRSFDRILLKSREDLRALRQNGIGGIRSLAAKNLSKIRQFKFWDDSSI
jgi:glycosyltransferase involved in cell wall biosynthesis